MWQSYIRGCTLSDISGAVTITRYVRNRCNDRSTPGVCKVSHVKVKYNDRSAPDMYKVSHVKIT